MKTVIITIFIAISLISVALYQFFMHVISNYSGHGSLGNFINRMLDPYLSNRTEFIETEHLEWAKILRENYIVIRDEYLNYVNNVRQPKRHREVDRMQRYYDTSSVPWDVVMLRLFYRYAEDAIHFPKTFKLIDDHLPTCSVVMFSILHPRKYIPKHRGPFSGVYRYHLGLITSNTDEAFIEVGGERRSWYDGQDLMFDDTLQHLAYNDADVSRVVLFLDVARTWRTRHPLLNTLLYWANSALMHLGYYNKTVKEIILNANKV